MMEALVFNRESNFIFYKKVLVLVLPMAIQNLINVGVTAADVIMLGTLGETAISGASLAGQVQFVMTLLFFGLTSGASVLTSQYWGKGDMRTIEKIMGVSLKISLTIGFIFTIITLTIPEYVMRIFSSEADVIEQGVSYLRIVAFSYIFIAITITYLNIIRSIERVIVSTVVYLISLIFNVILNSILIFGLFGFPAMGIKGAAIATLMARILEFIIVSVYAKKFNKVLNVKIKDLLHQEKWLIKDFITYSLPVITNELLWGVGTSTYAAIIGHLGQSAVAANSIAQVTRQFATVVSFGIANATAILVGKAIGEKSKELAKLYGKKLLRLSVVLGSIGGIIVLCISPVARAYLNIGETANTYLKYMMYVMSYFTFAQSINCTAIVGIFRGGGDTKIGLLLDTVSMWGFSILFGFISAFVLKLPVIWVYVILMSDEVLKLPFSFWRFKSYKWIKNVTR